MGGRRQQRCKIAGASTLPQMLESVILGRKASSECEQKAEQEQINRSCRATPPTYGRASACRCRDARGGTHVSRKPVSGTAMGGACGRTPTRSRRLEQQSDIRDTPKQPHRARRGSAHSDVFASSSRRQATSASMEPKQSAPPCSIAHWKDHPRSAPSVGSSSEVEPWTVSDEYEELLHQSGGIYLR